MEQQRKVKTIPATLKPFTSSPIGENRKRRVAAYARVSTDHDEQFTSYEAQIDYYTKYIKARNDWDMSVCTLMRALPAQAQSTARDSSKW